MRSKQQHIFFGGHKPVSIISLHIPHSHLKFSLSLFHSFFFHFRLQSERKGEEKMLIKCYIKESTIAEPENERKIMRADFCVFPFVFPLYNHI